MSKNEGSIQKYKVVGGNNPDGGPKVQSSEASYLESSQTESVNLDKQEVLSLFTSTVQSDKNKHP